MIKLKKSNYLSIIVYIHLIAYTNSNRNRGSQRSDNYCALFRSNDTVALTLGKSTYLEIGQIDVADDFSISMDVLPSPLNHNGILLSIGTRPDFEYYEWKTKAVHTQFLVVEFIFSALALTVKALNTEHLQQIEVYRTYPIPYSIDDGSWHNIRVFRMQDKDKTYHWKLFVGNINVTRTITNSTDVQLFGKPAFIGGRPNYTDHQFQGVIKNLVINNRPIHLQKFKPNGMAKKEFVDIVPCNESTAQIFQQWVKQTKIHANIDSGYN